jgi:hypothetical protein
MKRHAVLLATAVALVLAAPSGVAAWGGTGHRFIGQAAARALPADLPAFLRTPQASDDIGEYALEPDNSKGSGKAHDVEMQSGHFLDLDENGKVLGGPLLSALPPARDLYEKSLQPFALDSWKAGYLPYSIIERWQILAKDFATWRVIVAAQANPAWTEHRAYYDAERRRREALILVHVGDLAHYAGDGSQPLHVTAHFNGWGDFPNPNGYSQAKIHAPFESEFVTHNLSLALVEARMAPLAVCGCAVEQEVVGYLTATGKQVEPLYQLQKEGALRDGDPRMIAFTAARLGEGAAETRNLVVEAWRASPNFSVGYRPIAVGDVVSGKVEPYNALKVVN